MSRQSATDLVTIREASRRLGLRNLSAYKAKYPGFPPPARHDHPQLWAWSEVEEWYRANVKPRKER